jgi:hypothetical protein
MVWNSGVGLHEAIASAGVQKVKGHKGFPYGLLKQRRLTEPIKTEKDLPPLTGLQIEYSNQLGHRSFSIRSSTAWR